MSHDYEHCLDWERNKCPSACFRARLTEDLETRFYPLETSWMHLRGTAECRRKDGKADGA